MSIRKNLIDEFGKRGKASVFDDDWHDLGGDKKSHGGGYQRCYHTHPALKLPGTDLVIYGGSCISPSVKDADVYIGFDYGMRMPDKNYPWLGRSAVLFEIPDMTAPKNVEEFKTLLSWTIDQLEDGKKVHAGCIGGHGRTGTFFAALVSRFGEQDAVTYVRAHYCQKAVESVEQVKFLEKHFVVLPVTPTKSHGSHTKSSSKHSTSDKKTHDKITVFSPLMGAASIWDMK